MDDSAQKIIFSKNLQRYISAKNKTQAEIAAAVGVSPQTFNTWARGIAIPRMNKVQLLADYFGIKKSDLIEDKSAQLHRPATIYESDSFRLTSPSRRLKDGAEGFIEAQLMALTRPTRSAMIEWLRDNYLGAASDGSDYEDFDDEKLEAFYNEIQILSRR